MPAFLWSVEATKRETAVWMPEALKAIQRAKTGKIS